MSGEPEAGAWEQAPVGLLRVDGAGRCLEVNTRARRLLGAAAGTFWVASVHADDRDRVRREWEASSARGEPAVFEFRVDADDEVWVLAEANAPDPAGRLIALTDVTAMRQRELGVASETAASQRTMDVLVEALDAISEGFAYFDADDRLVVFNRRHRELFPSYAQALIPGALFADLLRAQLRNIELSAAVGREEEYIAERVAEHRNPGGTREQVWNDGRVIRLSEYRTGSGGVVSIRADITDLKRAEAEVRRLNEDLERRVEERTEALHAAQGELVRKERLATLGQLTATVNHELRNPLATMYNAYALLQRLPIGNDERIQRAVSQLGQGLVRCRQIVDELLDFTQVRKNEMTAVVVDDWVGQIVGELDSRARVTLAFEPGVGEQTVRIDPHRLRRALVNVIENAIQAVEETRSGPGCGAVWVSTDLAEKCLRISVRDDGPGIGEDDLDQIFEPLYSTRVHGFGLGLPTVRQILVQHGGRVTVESAGERGSMFRLWLPGELLDDARR